MYNAVVQGPIMQCLHKMCIKTGTCTIKNDKEIKLT